MTVPELTHCVYGIVEVYVFPMKLILLVSVTEVDRRLFVTFKILEVRAVDVDRISEFRVDVFKVNVEPKDVDI